MRLCTVPHCGRKHVSNDLCAVHYMRLRRGGTLASAMPERSRVTPSCSVYDCEERATAKGMCARHRVSFVRHGNPVYTDCRKEASQ